MLKNSSRNNGLLNGPRLQMVPTPGFTCRQYLVFWPKLRLTTLEISCTHSWPSMTWIWSIVLFQTTKSHKQKCGEMQQKISRIQGHLISLLPYPGTEAMNWHSQAWCCTGLIHSHLGFQLSSNRVKLPCFSRLRT